MVADVETNKQSEKKKTNQTKTQPQNNQKDLDEFGYLL